MQDYYRFGVVPGVSLDVKALATNYGIPFVSIGGRDHNGKMTVSFMGFIPNEREERMACFLDCFKQFVITTLCTLCCDQDAAILHVAENQFPTTHLNKNQSANCTEEYKKTKSETPGGSDLE